MNAEYIRALWPLLLGLYALLLCGSVIRVLSLRQKPPELRRSRLLSLRTWWLLALGFGGVLWLHSMSVAFALMGISLLALREYLQLTGTRLSLPLKMTLIALTVAVFMAALFSHRLFYMLPLIAFAGFATVGIVRAETEGYLLRNAQLLWGWLILAFALAHSVLFLTTQPTAVGPLEGIQWVFFLILMTEVNDIAQAIIGRAFGSSRGHKITPVVSPNKTWEGFLGGLCVTILMAVVLVMIWPDLSASSDLSAEGAFSKLLYALGLGLTHSLAGFVGDLNMSALKRDLKVKDSSGLLPGMGGLIDRIDSLTFTAPALYYYVTAFANF